AVAGRGDPDGPLKDLPVFVRLPNGQIKENIMYNWASSPLERLSGFANGHFDIADNIRLTGQAMVTRTKTESSLGLASANINQWGAGVPFGDAIYTGNTNTYFDIPSSVCAAVGPGCPVAGGTNQNYTINGRFGVNCAAPLGSPTVPWADGKPGCSMSEAWPTTAAIYNVMKSRGVTTPPPANSPPGTPGTFTARPNDIIWANRE